MAEKVNLDDKLALIDGPWLPRTIAAVASDAGTYEVKVVKIEGEFVRHQHDDTDELFLVLDGEMTIRLPDRDVVLGPRELFVVPRGVPHQPYAAAEARVLLLEPAGVVNTGEAGGPLTTTPVWDVDDRPGAG